jgi:hypothetical protein
MRREAYRRAGAQAGVKRAGRQFEAWLAREFPALQHSTPEQAASFERLARLAFVAGWTEAAPQFENMRLALEMIATHGGNKNIPRMLVIKVAKDVLASRPLTPLVGRLASSTRP